MRRRSESFFRRPGCLNSGFTLLEVVIALTVLGLILVVIFGAFRIGISAWETGEAKQAEYEKVRVVSQLISQQVKSMVPYKFKTQKAEGDYFAFDGKTNSLRFVSGLSLKKREAEGLVYVVYKLKEGSGEGGGQLVVYEQRALNRNFFEDDLQEDSNIVLMEGIEDIRFEYFQEEDKLKNREEGWIEAWDAKEKNEFPKALRLTIHQKQENGKGSLFPIRMTISLPAYRFEDAGIPRFIPQP